MDEQRLIAYSSDRPPMLVPPPCSFLGALWAYEPATQQAAVKALQEHRRLWPDWGVDPELVALAGE